MYIYIHIYGHIYMYIHCYSHKLLAKCCVMNPNPLPSNTHAHPSTTPGMGWDEGRHSFFIYVYHKPIERSRTFTQCTQALCIKLKSPKSKPCR